MYVKKENNGELVEAVQWNGTYTQEICDFFRHKNCRLSLMDNERMQVTMVNVGRNFTVFKGNWITWNPVIEQMAIYGEEAFRQCHEQVVKRKLRIYGTMQVDIDVDIMELIRYHLEHGCKVSIIIKDALCNSEVIPLYKKIYEITVEDKK